MSKKSPKHRTKTQRAADLVTMAKLDRQGWSQWDIANHLGISQPQVCYDLKAIRKKYAAETVVEREVQVQMLVQAYREIIKEAWEAYRLSSQDLVTTEKTEYPVRDKEEGEEDHLKSRLKGMKRLKKKSKDTHAILRLGRLVTTTVGQRPGSDYLRVIIEALDKIADLTGAKPVRKVDGTINVVNWDALVDTLPPKEITDTIDLEIQKTLAYIPSENGNGEARKSPEGEQN